MARSLPPGGALARTSSGVLAIALLCVPVPAAPAPPDLAPYYRAHRPDRLEPVAGTPPSQIRVLPPGGPERWSASLRARLEERVRREWPRDRTYGALQSAVGLWLAFPLVTGQDRGRLLVPVVMEKRLPIRGVVDLPDRSGPRRVILLVDASSSANTRSLLRTAEGSVERVTPLEAERSAVAGLLDVLGEADIELGVVAYGERTWPLAPPGTAPSEIRAQLAAWQVAQPRGVGRTDLLCALELARDWLRDTPKGVSKEVFLLTDGGLPHSGRFLDCRMSERRGGKKALQACEARRNRTPCPAPHRFRESDGYSDLRQLDAFLRRARRALTVYPLVFDSTRPARPYQELARATGGDLYRVPSAEALEASLPALALGQVRAVYALNERTGRRTPNLLDAKTGRFVGILPLKRGANDVLLTVEGMQGPAARYRFRIYAEPNFLKRVLVELRNENRTLSERARNPSVPRRLGPPSPSRKLDVGIDPMPAAPAAP